GKRPKQVNIGGLKPNWKKVITKGTKKNPMVTPKPHQSSPEEDQDDGAKTDFLGEFAVDEVPEVLAASRAVKLEVGPSRKKGTATGLKDLGTAKMGSRIPLIKIKVEESSASQTQKEPAKRYVNADLPLANPSRDLKKWQMLVLSALTDWAGTLDDPFHANSHDNFKNIVDENWVKVFGDRKTNDAVYDMVTFYLFHFELTEAASLRNWRSNIGKRALKFYKHNFEQEPFKNSPEKIKLYVLKSMSDMVVNGKGMGLKFIYLDQDAERGLLAWKDGTSPDDNFKSFVDKPWGSRAAAYLPGIQKLSDLKWAKLCELTAEVIKIPDTNNIVDLTADDEDPRSQVLLSDDSD
ncbi:hypothetical protein BYT27DRAFT_7108408, partial [Phlegmacium glaucopus]